MLGSRRFWLVLIGYAAVTFVVLGLPTVLDGLRDETRPRRGLV